MPLLGMTESNPAIPAGDIRDMRTWAIKLLSRHKKGYFSDTEVDDIVKRVQEGNPQPYEMYQRMLAIANPMGEKMASYENPKSTFGEDPRLRWERVANVDE